MCDNNNRDNQNGTVVEISTLQTGNFTLQSNTKPAPKPEAISQISKPVKKSEEE